MENITNEPTTETAKTEVAATTETVKAEKDAVVLLAATDERIPEAMRPLVESGALEAEMKTVEVEVKGQKDKAKRDYVRLTALTIEGGLALVGGRMTKVSAKDEDGKDVPVEQRGNGVLDYFNYGYDLGVRSTVRNALLLTLEGPEKAIERGVKGLMAAGIDETVARGIVIEQRKLKGLAV